MPVVEQRGWVKKFSAAFCGIWYGARGESSFVVHLAATCAVLIAGCYFRVAAGEWCLLVLSITAVFVSELFNSSLEQLARAVDAEFNPFVGRALDIASGAVLVASLGAACVGAIVFLPRLMALTAGP